MNGPFLKAVRPVMDQLTELMLMMEDHPARAIDVAVVHGTSGFKLVVRNVGTGQVVIADPRHASQDGTSTCGWVGAAKEVLQPPGSGPIPLQPVGFAPLGTRRRWSRFPPASRSRSTPSPGGPRAPENTSPEAIGKTTGRSPAMPRTFCRSSPTPQRWSKTTGRIAFGARRFRRPCSSPRGRGLSCWCQRGVTRSIQVSPSAQ